MGRYSLQKGTVLGLFIGFFIGMTLMGSLIENNREIISDSAQFPPFSLTSTNPSSPSTMISNNRYGQTHSSSTSYYFRTSTTVSPSYYHVVWLNPISSINVNLYLYSDSSYSNLRASSTRGTGLGEWVIFRPSNYQYYYPRVYAYQTGYAYRAWEYPSYTISSDGSINGYFSSSDYIEIYQVELSHGETYNFKLEVPSGGDFDLYLYYLSAGAATNSYGYERAIANPAYGFDERLEEYQPTYTGTYAIIVVKSGGSGSFTLECHPPFSFNPLLVVVLILVVICFLGISVAIYNKIRQRSEPARTGQTRRQSRRSTQNRLPTRRSETTISTRRIDPVNVPQTPRQTIFVNSVTGRIETINIVDPEPMTISRDPTKHVCPHCEKENQENAIFCVYCGTEL